MTEQVTKPEDKLKDLSTEIKSLSDAASILFNQSRLKLPHTTSIYFESLIRGCSTLSVYANLVAVNAESKSGAVLMCLEEGKYLLALTSKLKDVFSTYVNEHMRAFADDMDAIASRVKQVVELTKPMIVENSDET